MIISGTGKIILTDKDREITFMQVENELIHVEPSHLLACEEQLSPRYVAVGDGGLEFLALEGRGMVALSVTGKPLPLAVRPDLPQLGRRFPPDREPRPLAVSGQVRGVAVRYPGIWEASAGVSDAADQASQEVGERTLAAIAQATAEFLVAFHERPFPQ